jgi:hypothetical protein
MRSASRNALFGAAAKHMASSAISREATVKPIIHYVREFTVRRRLAFGLCHAILSPHRVSFLGVRIFFDLPRGQSGQFDRIGFPSSL